jgi:hypothetical protein
LADPSAIIRVRRCVQREPGGAVGLEELDDLRGRL